MSQVSPKLRSVLAIANARPGTFGVPRGYEAFPRNRTSVQVNYQYLNQSGTAKRKVIYIYR